MATWQDGPEYAPLERPDGFDLSSAEPLPAGPPPVPVFPAAPVERPVFAEPAAAVAPLAALVPPPADPRDPQQPFEVAASSMTGAGPWAEVHGAGPGGAPVAGPAAAPAWPAPALAGPTQPSPATPSLAPGPPEGAVAGVPFPRAPAVQPDPFPPPAPFPGAAYPPAAPTQPYGVAPPPAPFPQPGTPQWFAPAPYGEQPGPGPVDARRVLDAATPGLLICLGVGGLLHPLAPVLLVVAFVLSSQVKAAREQVRQAFAIGLGLVGVLAMIKLFNNPIDFADWWHFVGSWSLVTCWAMVVSTVVLVRRALRAGTPPGSPPYRGPWG